MSYDTVYTVHLHDTVYEYLGLNITSKSITLDKISESTMNTGLSPPEKRRHRRTSAKYYANIIAEENRDPVRLSSGPRDDIVISINDNTLLSLLLLL